MNDEKKRRDALEHVEAVPEVLQSRPRPKPKRDRSWDAQRSKATYDLPEELIDRVRDIAEALKVPQYDVARMLMEAGLEQYESGELELKFHVAERRLYPE